jgi:hypothetical protein
MQQLSEYRARSRIGKVLGALLCVAALSQPNPAYAQMHGGGGFHGGRFGGFHADRFHDGRFRSGFFGFGFGLGPYYGYPYYSYPYYSYDYGQPYSQTWYYCSEPAGYYPYVSQCNTGWQTVPAS